MSKMYIAVLDEFSDHMVPTLVAHAVLGAHIKFSAQKHDSYWGGSEPAYPQYIDWLKNSFKKCVVRVNDKEFSKIAALPDVHIAHESNTLGGKPSCVIVCPRDEIPNVLKFAKLWGPKV
jgi:peptidyl-tRNA hydrolase